MPQAWREAVVMAPIGVISGSSSYSHPDGRTDFSAYHLHESWANLRHTAVHEWGHHLAWAYGTHAYNGAPPEGFPTAGPALHVEETWAQAVAVALLGYDVARRNVPPPNAEQVAWAKNWLAAGPGGHQRTG